MPKKAPSTELKKQVKNGLIRCPHCGATDVSFDFENGKLKCQFCRTLFEAPHVNAAGGVDKLKAGRVVGDGAGDIIPDEKYILTLKCPACGAEVVINADEVTSARCHWCRHVFSLNEKMPNGAVPDMVLPFKLKKEQAVKDIRDFAAKRKFYAHPKFRREFKPENVMGVYLPYMVIDMNAHAKMEGEGEHLAGTHEVGWGDNQKTVYDADLYRVEREFDLLVDDLTIESSLERLNQNTLINTNNVINAIMPFDTEEAVGWDPRFLRGFASEKRDTNVDDLAGQVNLQLGDIARYKARETIKFYDRGVRWDLQQFSAKGESWKAAYLPVWLYSYLEEGKKGKLLHYVAVNARSGKTMGSIPINKTKLKIIATIIEIIGIFLGLRWFMFWAGMNFDLEDKDNPAAWGLLGFTPGFIYYWLVVRHYRNMDKRHIYERETRAELIHLSKKDQLVKRMKGLENSQMRGRNDLDLKGGLATRSTQVMLGEKLAEKFKVGKLVDLMAENWMQDGYEEGAKMQVDSDEKEARELGVEKQTKTGGAKKK